MPVRGYPAWNPKGKTVYWLARILRVLDEDREELPLMAREIFYRLVAAFDYPKTEPSYNRLLSILGRARRAFEAGGGFGIPFDWVYDGGQSHSIDPLTFEDDRDFIERMRSAAEAFQLDRQTGQEVRVELWCEASGWLPLLEELGREYSAKVTTSSGYDSTPLRHELAKRVLSRLDDGLRTVVLHVGDFDPSGEDMVRVLEEDVAAMVEDKADEDEHPFDWFRVCRVALTGKQVIDLNVVTAPAKPKDSRMERFLERNWRVVEALGTEHITAQLEALPRARLRELVRDAIEAELDMDMYALILGEEAAPRARLLDGIDQL